MPKQSKSLIERRSSGAANSRTYSKTPRGRYIKLRKTAGYKGTSMGLSFEEFKLLALAPCGYCGKEVPAGYTGSWIDQIEAGKGYTVVNSLSCCGSCNRVKSDEFNQAEMRSLGKLIKRIREKK